VWPMSPQPASVAFGLCAGAGPERSSAMAEPPWRPVPTCPAAHPLESKVVAGSWFTACKSCSKCRTQLTSGLYRHSCKKCNFHLCAACADLRAEEMLNEDITLTVYRAAQQGLLPGMGVEEDAWQVSIRRGATVGALKVTIANLYGLHPGLQALRRDADSQPMLDTEPLRYDDGDVVYLSAAGPAGLAAGLLGGLTGGGIGVPGGGGGELDGLAAALSNAAAEAANAVSGALAEAAARREELATTEYKLGILLLASGKRPEKRCDVTVMAGARVAEVLEMVKLELDVEDEELALEFAGEKLPLGANVHVLGLRDGDTVMASLKDSRTSL